MAPSMSSASLKHVIEYLEPSLRCRLSACCPSLRHIEKSIPLHIKHLILTPDIISVNKTTYQLEVVKNGPNNTGVPFDIDNHGKEDRTEVISTSEDEILIDGRTLAADPRQEICILNREMMAMHDVILQAYTEVPPVLPKKFVHHAEKRSRNHLQDWVPNVIPETDYHIRLTRSMPFLQERVAYTKKLHEAMKYLVERLLGGKQLKNQKLEVCSESGVLCLPRSITICSRNLELLDQKTELFWSKFRVLLDPKSIPFKSLELRGPIPMEYDEIQSSKLILNGSLDENIDLEFEKLLKLTNREVELTFDTAGAHFIKLAEHWVETLKPLGKCYRFTIYYENEARKLLKEIKDTFWEEAEVFHGPYEFPITFNVLMRSTTKSEVSIHCMRDPEVRGRWIFSMKVQKPGTIIN